MWNRLRYTVWAPGYDAIARAAGFDTARRLSIDDCSSLRATAS